MFGYSILSLSPDEILCVALIIGAVSAIAMATAYGIGYGVVALVRYVNRPMTARERRRVACHSRRLR